MTHGRSVLSQILVRIRELKQKGQDSLVVFDLDSTLFDVVPRIEKILVDFAAVPAHQQNFPEQVQHFKNIKVERKDWGIKGTLLRSGLDGHHPEFQSAVKNFWVKHFFSNEYLVYDKPYDGAVEYVQKIAEAGAQIAYLTGRDVHRMGIGTKEILLKWKFPLNDMSSRLVLKPQKGIDDAIFKTEWFMNLPKDRYNQIWFFENEPANILPLRQQAPHIDIVFFDSTHSGRAEPPEDIPTILHFVLDPHTEENT